MIISLFFQQRGLWSPGVTSYPPPLPRNWKHQRNYVRISTSFRSSRDSHGARDDSGPPHNSQRTSTKLFFMLHTADGIGKLNTAGSPVIVTNSSVQMTAPETVLLLIACMMTLRRKPHTTFQCICLTFNGLCSGTAGFLSFRQRNKITHTEIQLALSKNACLHQCTRTYSVTPAGDEAPKHPHTKQVTKISP